MAPGERSLPPFDDASSAQRFARQALAGIRHAQRPMHEHLQWHTFTGGAARALDGLDLADLFQ